jgi:hypothetical protein
MTSLALEPETWNGYTVEIETEVLGAQNAHCIRETVAVLTSSAFVTMYFPDNSIVKAGHGDALPDLVNRLRYICGRFEAELDGGWPGTAEFINQQLVQIEHRPTDVYSALKIIRDRLHVCMEKLFLHVIHFKWHARLVHLISQLQYNKGLFPTGMNVYSGMAYVIDGLVAFATCIKATPGYGHLPNFDDLRDQWEHDFGKLFSRRPVDFYKHRKNFLVSELIPRAKKLLAEMPVHDHHPQSWGGAGRAGGAGGPGFGTGHGGGRHNQRHVRSRSGSGRSHARPRTQSRPKVRARPSKFVTTSRRRKLGRRH